jgi:acyl carrier protein
MERTEIFKKVSEIFQEILEDDELLIKEEYGSNDIDEWDSLTHIMLIVEIEKKFNIKFLSKEISSWDNIGEMITSIKLKV